MKRRGAKAAAGVAAAPSVAVEVAGPSTSGVRIAGPWFVARRRPLNRGLSTTPLQTTRTAALHHPTRKDSRNRLPTRPPLQLLPLPQRSGTYDSAVGAFLVWVSKMRRPQPRLLLQRPLAALLSLPPVASAVGDKSPKRSEHASRSIDLSSNKRKKKKSKLVTRKKLKSFLILSFEIEL